MTTARRTRSQLARYFAGSLTALVLLAEPALAHYVYKAGWVYRSAWACAWARAELSHGNGGGYTRLDVTAFKATNSPTSYGDRCHSSFQRNPGQLRVKHQLWKQSGSGAWTLCRDSGWITNGAVMSSFSKGITYGASPPCGPGTYGITGFAEVWDGRAWRGGKIEGGTHYLG